MRVAELHCTWEEFKVLVGTKSHENFDLRRDRYLAFVRACAMVPPSVVDELSSTRQILLVPHIDTPIFRVVFVDLDDDQAENARKWHDDRRDALSSSPLTEDERAVP